MTEDFTLENTPSDTDAKDPNRDLWATPQELVDAVSKFMGKGPHYDLCASAENAKAPWWIGEDGSNTHHGFPLEDCDPEHIAGHLGGRAWAWCNPPYSAQKILSVCIHLGEIAEFGGTIALLVNIDESTRWHAAIRPYIRARLVLTRRVQFIPPPGVAPSTNSRSQTIYILGPRRPWDGPSYPTLTLDYPREQNLSLFEKQ